MKSALEHGNTLHLSLNLLSYRVGNYKKFKFIISGK